MVEDADFGVVVSVLAGASATTASVDFIRITIYYTSISAPTITISAASLITANTARLNGNVTVTGGENPSVLVFWGDNDGVQTPANWDNNPGTAPTSPGQPQGVAAFYLDITGLNPGTKYYFSADATNSGGTSWPAASLNFTTTPAPFKSYYPHILAH